MNPSALYFSFSPTSVPPITLVALPFSPQSSKSSSLVLGLGEKRNYVAISWKSWKRDSLLKRLKHKHRPWLFFRMFSHMYFLCLIKKFRGRGATLGWVMFSRVCQKTKNISDHLALLVCQKCPFSSAKKWHFERPNLTTDSKNLAKHPPKWLGRHLGHAFPFSGE